MKKTILHIIQDLGRGGAETILVSTVNELEEFNNIVVTLFEANQFEGQLRADKLYCFNVKSLLLLPFYAWKLRKIIRKHKVDIVHSRLYWSTFLARIATPRSVPLVTTIHTYVAESVEYKNPIIRWIEKISYRFHKTTMLADSQGALDEYFSFLKLRPYKAVSPFTFVDTRIFSNSQPVKLPGTGTLRMVTTGRLTIQKNHQYLAEAFKKLRDDDIEVDIYGAGVKYDELKKQVDEFGLRINLKGQVFNVHEILADYHVFVMPSLYEGFSLSVLEAMAAGLPLLLSDMPSFREQCDSSAAYFDLNDPDDFVSKARMLKADQQLLQKMGEAAKERVLKHFTLDHHMKAMRKIYSDVLAEKEI